MSDLNMVYHNTKTGFYAIKSDWLKTVSDFEGRTPEEAFSELVEDGTLKKL